MHNNIIQEVAKLSCCPHCEAEWTHNQEICNEIYNKNLTNEMGRTLSTSESIEKAVKYGWSVGNAKKFTKVEFILSTSKEDCYYQCPECETLFDLYSGKEYSSHERSVRLAALTT